MYAVPMPLNQQVGAMQSQEKDSTGEFRKVGSKLFWAVLALVFGLVGMSCTSPTPHSELGRVSFANSGGAEAQAAFSRGVAALHSFWYEEATVAFQEAQQIDPTFAMAYWGEAMSYNHVLWERQDLDGARAALHRFAPTPEERLAKTKTPRERALMAAVDILYDEGTKQQRDAAYAEAMRALSESYPDDVDIASLYALSILGTIQLGQDFHGAMQAAAVLEPFFNTHPRHPGVLHYLIHAYDDPVHAGLGLRPARLYADVAPAASHALHMPAHIFVQLGRWEEATQSDEASFGAQATRVAREGLSAGRHNYHSLAWMVYAYTQGGHYARAREKLAFAEQVVQEHAIPRVGQTLAAMKARYVIETRHWQEAKGLFAVADTMALGRTQANVFLAAGIAAVHTGDLAMAKAVLTRLRQNRTHYELQGEAAEADVMALMAVEVEALVSHAEGNTERALRLLEGALPVEEKMGFPTGPPSRPFKPVIELYGETLLEAGRPEEAMHQFERSLRRTPNRAASLIGLARATAQAGYTDLAARHYAAFSALWNDADAGLAEAEEARHWAAK